MIAIKDFEMPISCSNCELCYDMCQCSVKYVEWDWEHFQTERNKDCPLVEIKTVS